MGLILRAALLVAALLAAFQLNAQTIRIWGEGTRHHASQALLTAYPCEGSSISVIVCPGGSYYWLDIDNEGKLVARQLNAAGISAYVLSYRVGGITPFIFHRGLVFRGKRHPDMIADLQRAISLVRSGAAGEPAPEKLGVMGFSAGGHLAMCSACFFDTDFPKGQTGAPSRTSLKPDFVAALYPVVTMDEPYVHRRSRRGLLGEGRVYSGSMRDSLSVEKKVRDDCPPVFLLNTEDDRVVDWQNSALLDSALTARGVPHEYRRFETGGHGFGSNDELGSAQTRGWMRLFVDWLGRLFPELSGAELPAAR